MSTKPDKIIVYDAMASGLVPRSQRFRWTRKSGVNGKKLAASSEGYARVRSALSNIERTQKPPYEVIIESPKS
jgi:hypothetical protein